jgi:hypothetical protein
MGLPVPTLRALKTAAFLLSLGLYLLCVAIAIGHGRVDLLHGEAMGQAFVDTWRGLMKWQFDVSPASIGWEGFVREGRTYMYFGPFPALIRGVMGLLFGPVSTDWSRVSFLIAAALFAVSTYAVCRSLMRILGADSLFYACLLTGATLLSSPFAFLYVSAAIYHESIIWALAWVMTGLAVFASDYRQGGLRLTPLSLVSLCAGLALLSRSLTSFSLVLLFGIVFVLTLLKDTEFARRAGLAAGAPNYLGRKRFIALSLLPVAVCGAFALTVNYYRWGSPLEFMPVEHHRLFKMSPERLKRFQSVAPINPKRVIHSLDYYLVPHSSDFSSEFPFLRLTPERNLGFGPAFLRGGDLSRLYLDYDWVEPSVPLTLLSPLLVMFSILGLLGSLRFGLPLSVSAVVLALLPPLLLIVSWPGLTMRYSAEFVPMLVVCSSLGAALLVKRAPGVASSWLTRACSIAILLAGVLATLSAIYLYKQLTWWVPKIDKARLLMMFQ